MNFSQVVTHTANRARVHHVQAAIRQQHGTGSTRWIAAETGVSQRTARRWMSTAAPVSRIPVIMELATREAIAAQRFRGATAIDVGAVAVEYDGEDQGDRNIGHLDVDDHTAAYLEQAAAALEEGDLAAAADAFSSAVIGGYSPGLEDTLSVSDYTSGVEIYE